MRTRTFWLLTGVMVLSLFTIPAVYVHLPQYARDLHLQVPRAHFVMLIGLWALLGNLLLGWLADRWGRRWVFGLSLTLGALALGGMTAARGVPLLTAASACFGVYYGTFASLFPAVMSDGFGRRSVGVLTQKRREAPAFMPGMDRRWARGAQCPRAQQDPRSTRALDG